MVTDQFTARRLNGTGPVDPKLIHKLPRLARQVEYRSGSVNVPWHIVFNA